MKIIFFYREPIDYLRSHVNINWLRPESALWDAIASSIISKYDITSPSLDLGCGNGIFSFITGGGNFSIDYDWYINVDTEGFYENRDIYDACKINNLKKYIVEKPRYKFTYGLDHKSNLLNQAKDLNFYDELIEYDANLQLPFEERKFKTIFSNILYWLKDIEKSLREIYRILERGGIALLCIPNNKIFDYCFTYNYKENSSELLRLLNRGRADCMYWTTSYNDFKMLVEGIGFKVIKHSYYLSPLTLKIWDIGLRPLSPLLIKMANGLKMEDRRAIKLEWIETVIKFLLPLFDMEIESKEEGGFHFFVLEK